MYYIGSAALRCVESIYGIVRIVFFGRNDDGRVIAACVIAAAARVHASR